MTRTLPRLSTLAATLLLAVAAQAQTGAPAAPGGTTARPAATDAGKPNLMRSDAGFLKQAAQDGHAEVEASKLALGKATDPGVKAFAQKMVDEHSKAGEDLMALAKTKGVELPTEPSIAQKAKMKLLQAADGASFDRRYAENIGVEAHESTVKMFRKAAADAKDADIRAWAAKMLPTLEGHLQEARALKSSTDAKKKSG